MRPQAASQYRHDRISDETLRRYRPNPAPKNRRNLDHQDYRRRSETRRAQESLDGVLGRYRFQLNDDA
jgi:hypothetical protein